MLPKKKQKQPESLVEMLVFYEKGQSSHGHTLLPWLGKQKWSRTSITAQGGPTQRPREWSPFARFKRSFLGLRDKKSGSLNHGLGSSYPDLGRASAQGLSCTDPKTVFSPPEIPGISVMWDWQGKPGSPLAKPASFLCFLSHQQLPRTTYTKT